jgi:hypothetical protein
LILTGVLSGIIGVLSWGAAVTTTFVPGVAAFYPAAAFEVVFGIWFGFWGAAAAYVGVMIAGLAAGWFSPPVGIVLSLSDFLLAYIPAWTFRKFALNKDLRGWRDVAGLIVSSVFVASFLGSLVYNAINLRLGVLQNTKAFWAGVVSWNVGNMVIIPLLAIPILKALTGLLEKSGLVVKGMVK